MARFYEVEERLPVSGVVPDMVSTTDFYLRLQEIYIEKAREDAAKLKVLVQEVAESRGLKVELDSDWFSLFCKHAC